MTQGKIDKVYDEMIKMEDRFRQLENDQQCHFEQHIEKASASIIVEIKRQISQLYEKIDKCECNKEIINLLKQDNGKRKTNEDQEEPVKKGLLKITGWHPENLKIEETPFYFKK